MISVILPTYNRAALLPRAVASVLNQTVRDLECIIVDDGSTDGTREVMQGLNDPRIRFVVLPHGGACAARNHGVSLAKGEYIAFQDSDDVWRPDKLEKQLVLLETAGADVVACAMLRDGECCPARADGPVTFDALLYESLCSSQCILGRRAVFEECPFDPDMPRLQDWELMLRISQKYRVHFLGEPLVDAYIMPDSISSQPEKRYAALLRLYAKHHAAICDLERRQMENPRMQPIPVPFEQTAGIHWLRMILEAAPEGAVPWTPELLQTAPGWVWRGEAPLDAEMVAVLPGEGAAPLNATLKLHLSLSGFRPTDGRRYIPAPLIPEMLRRVGERAVYCPPRNSQLPCGTGLSAALPIFVERFGRCRAWALLTAGFGAERVVCELAARPLEARAWAAALKDVRLPLREGAVRRVGVYYHRLTGGGVQRVMVALIRLYVQMGYEVTCITTRAANPEGDDLPASVKRLVIPAASIVEAEDCRAHASALLEAAHGLDVLVYHAWADEMILYDLLAAHAAGCRFLVHTHSVFTMPLLEPALRDRFDLLPDVYCLVQGVVTLSDADAAWWRQFCPRVWKTVHPLTCTPESTPVNPLTGSNILWMGRFSPEKRPMDAVQIMKAVARKNGYAHLIMLGSEPGLPEMIRRAVQAEGLDGRVTILPWSDDPRSILAQADIFLCTSEYEGFCLSMVEAQTFGVPCVTWDMPWLTIQQGRGHIAVPHGDIQAAADAIVTLLTDGPRRMAMGRAARENAETRMNIDQRSQWQRIFDGLACTEPIPPSSPETGDAMALRLLRAHTARMKEQSAMARGEAACQPTAFVPLPEKGPCKMLRKKTATFLQLLLIGGPSGVCRAMREKRLQKRRK